MTNNKPPFFDENEHYPLVDRKMIKAGLWLFTVDSVDYAEATRQGKDDHLEGWWQWSTLEGVKPPYGGEEPNLNECEGSIWFHAKINGYRIVPLNLSLFD